MNESPFNVKAIESYFSYNTMSLKLYNIELIIDNIEDIDDISAFKTPNLLPIISRTICMYSTFEIALSVGLIELDDIAERHGLRINSPWLESASKAFDSYEIIKNLRKRISTGHSQESLLMPNPQFFISELMKIKRSFHMQIHPEIINILNIKQSRKNADKLKILIKLVADPSRFFSFLAPRNRLNQLESFFTTGSPRLKGDDVLNLLIFIKRIGSQLKINHSNYKALDLIFMYFEHELNILDIEKIRTLLGYFNEWKQEIHSYTLGDNKEYFVDASEIKKYEVDFNHSLSELDELLTELRLEPNLA